VVVIVLVVGVNEISSPSWSGQIIRFRRRESYGNFQCSELSQPLNPIMSEQITCKCLIVRSTSMN
jgi:hypothetical protein